MTLIFNPLTNRLDDVPDDTAAAYQAALWQAAGQPPLPADLGQLPARTRQTDPTDQTRPMVPEPPPAPTAITDTPRSRRRTRKLIVPWSAKTCAAVRDGLPDRYQAMVDTGQGLGLRFGELSALAAEDLDRGNVLVRRQVKRVRGTLVWAPPKDDSYGCPPLDPQLAATLDNHTARYPAAAVTLPWNTPDGLQETFHLLFATTSSGPLDRSYFRRLWVTAVSAAGMTPGRTTGTHQLRHHFASELVAAGTDLETVRRLLRHADLLTTQVYVHSLAISDRQARKAVAKVTPKPKPAPALPAGVADLSAYRLRKTS